MPGDLLQVHFKIGLNSFVLVNVYLFSDCPKKPKPQHLPMCGVNALTIANFKLPKCIPGCRVGKRSLYPAHMS